MTGLGMWWHGAIKGHVQSWWEYHSQFAPVPFSWRIYRCSCGAEWIIRKNT